MCDNFSINSLKRQIWALSGRVDLSVRRPLSWRHFGHNCSVALRHNSRSCRMRTSGDAPPQQVIILESPSNKINGLQFQYRVKTLVLDKLLALLRNVCETRQLRQTLPVRSLHTFEFLCLFRGKIYPYILPWSIKPCLFIQSKTMKHNTFSVNKVCIIFITSRLN